MHSSLNRLNSIFALATSVLLCMLAVIDTTSFPRRNDTGSKVTIKSLETVSGRAVWHMDRRTQDYLVTSFDVQANFTELFKWNTKQVFVSLVAEYEDRKKGKNEVVIWDRIIRSVGDANVSLRDEENKYGLREVSRSFSGIDNTTLTLRWNVMPKVGLLHYGTEVTSSPSSHRIPARIVKTDAEGNKLKEKVRQMYY